MQKQYEICEAELSKAHHNHTTNQVRGANDDREITRLETLLEAKRKMVYSLRAQYNLTQSKQTTLNTKIQTVTTQLRACQNKTSGLTSDVKLCRFATTSLNRTLANYRTEITSYTTSITTLQTTIQTALGTLHGCRHDVIALKAEVDTCGQSVLAHLARERTNLSQRQRLEGLIVALESNVTLAHQRCDREIQKTTEHWTVKYKTTQTQRHSHSESTVRKWTEKYNAEYARWASVNATRASLVGHIHNFERTITYYENQLHVLEAWFKTHTSEAALIAKNRELEGEYNATMREMHTLGAENVALQGAFDHALIEELAERREYERLLHAQYVWALAHAKAEVISTTTISSGSSSTTSGTTTSTTTTHSSSSSSSSSTATATVSGGGSTTVQALEVDAQPETTESSISSAGAAGITVAGLALGASAFALYKKKQNARKEGLDSFLMQA